MENIMFKVKELNLERFFGNKDLISLDEIIDKLYELDDDACYWQERYDDAHEIDRYYGEADRCFREGDPELPDRMHELNLLGLE